MYGLLKNLKSEKNIKQKPFDYCGKAKKSPLVKVDAMSKHILIKLGYYFEKREN